MLVRSASNKKSIMVTQDKTGVDLQFVITNTGWSESEAVTRIKNMPCFSAFYQGRQIGFACVNSDFKTFAIMDKIVVDKSSMTDADIESFYFGIGSAPELKGVDWTFPEDKYPAIPNKSLSSNSIFAHKTSAIFEPIEIPRAKL